MKNLIKLPIYILYFVFVTKIAVQKSNIKQANWLIGTWENKTVRGSVYENWEITNAKEFSGKSFMTRENDTIVFENIKLLEEKNQLYYIPIVKNQNKGLPVKFKATIINDNELIFENLSHDFPQKISYIKINKDSLVAEISGIRKGKLRKQTFPMKRIN